MTASGVPSTEPNGATAAVLNGGQTPLKGVWSGTAERLASFLVGVCPSPRFTVPASVLAEYYVRYCAEAGLRADLLWAQMIHETGYGMYGGAVLPEQNNYAGIGATGEGEPGVSFPTAEAGVIAHVAHMVAYVYASSPVSWADAINDPRFDFVNPRGAASILADLNGRWAVPGTTYGESIESIARAINAT
jgi:N-acetylmuramoyl-L-alanine amidase